MAYRESYATTCVRYRTELALMRVHAVCDAAHSRIGPLHVKD